jgi:putative nucleotidyltransferase with HDIG domain
MSVSSTTCSPTAVGVPDGFADRIRDRLGVAVAFYRLDGTPVAGAHEHDRPPAAAPAEVVTRLVREAARLNEDRLAGTSDGLAAAWPIGLRGRPRLVAAAELPLEGEAERPMASRLLAAVGEALRAGVAEADARLQCDSLAEALSQSFEEISLLHNVGDVLRVTRPVRGMLEYVCAELRETTGAEAAVAYLPGADGEAAETVVCGCLPLLASDLPDLFDELLDGLDAEGNVLINNHCRQSPALARFSKALNRLVAVPVALGEGTRGAMAALNRSGEEFGSPDAKLIRSSANASAVFIENRRLYNELQQMMLSLVRALVSSVDAKDPYTCGHSERVSVTSREIARQLALDDELIEQTYMAGLLHDIGKIGTPEAILRKDGPLQPEERRIINRHPEIGGHILSGIPKLEPVREAVIHHHERVDGNGYPAGLKGDAIPQSARIVALADAVDAMTSTRPYRPMLPLEHAVREVQQNKGTQFDAAVVEAFFRLDLNRLTQQFAQEPATPCVAHV